MWLRAIVIAGLLTGSAPAPTRAADPDFRVLASGLEAPTSVTTDKAGRTYITSKNGRIYRISGKKRTTWDEVQVNATGEGGLLSMEVLNRQRYYAAYTDAAMALQVSRFTRNGGERKIIRIPHREYSNHNGGQIQLHKGLLYISTGDGGGGGDPRNKAGKPNTLLGKILRIDPTCGSKKFCIPAANPRRGNPVIAYGLRNPWRFSIDSDQLWIGDVGQDAREEVDRMPANPSRLFDFGWSCREGTRVYNPDRCAGRNLTKPVLTYGRTDGGSITGGYVYRGTDVPSLRGSYIYGDFISGTIWAFRDGRSRRIGAAGGVTSFGLTADGELLLVTIDGTLQRMTAG